MPERGNAPMSVDATREGQPRGHRFFEEVIYVDDPGGVVHDYAVTREELLALVRYWTKQYVEIEF